MNVEQVAGFFARVLGNVVFEGVSSATKQAPEACTPEPLEWNCTCATVEEVEALVNRLQVSRWLQSCSCLVCIFLGYGFALLRSHHGVKSQGQGEGRERQRRRRSSGASSRSSEEHSPGEYSDEEILAARARASEL